ncbi:MAG: ATP-binding cassette domain-containing protein, partial [Gammaproteobacteria bacterium]
MNSAEPAASERAASAARAASVLAVRHLAKTYRSRRVVKDVSLTVRAGEVIGLLGPNGAGKTTSFYMIVGLVTSEGGSIQLDSEDLTRLP